MKNVERHRRRDLDLNELKVWYQLPELPLEGKTLVVLDEVFWREGSYDTFERELAKGSDVLAFGSRGPEYDTDKRWSRLQGLSYHTWQLNTKVTREFLQPMYEKDPLRAARDYEGF